MAEYIERKDALYAIGTITMYKGSISHDLARRKIESIPAADVQPVKHGKWIPHIEEDYIGEGQYGYIELLKCSECGTLVPNKRNFYHHCGAKMEVDG